MTKIVLDAESFKALASDSRLQIMKALDARPLTVSELSRLLNLNKATVFEHLKLLLTAELAKREDDPDRKWVYYRLTWKGKNVLHPENAQIFLMLSLAAMGVGGAVVQAGRMLRLWLTPRLETQSELGAGGTSPEPSPSPEAMLSSQGDSSNDQSGGSQSPGSAQGPASTTPAPDQREDAGQPGVGVGDGQGGQEPPWWETVTGMDIAIFALIFVLVALIALVVWTMLRGQRQERRRVRDLLDLLPADVNAQEERLA